MLSMAVVSLLLVALLVVVMLVFGCAPFVCMLMLNCSLLVTILIAHGHDRCVQILQRQTADG